MAVTTAGVAIANLGVNTSAWMKGLTKAGRAWTKFGATLQVAGFRLATTIGAAITAIGVAAFKFGSDFETAFAGVRKTLKITSEHSEQALGIIREGLLEISRVTPFAATELANIARVGAQLGVQPQNIIKFTQTIAKLGVAVKELDMETAARGLSRLIKVTGGSMDDIDRVASVLAQLGDNFGTTEEAILKFSGRVSGLAAVSGMTAQDLMGIGAAVTQVREQVESGATAIAKEMGILVEAVATNSKKLELMGRITGQTAEQFAKAWKDDAAAAIVDVTEALGAMGGMAIPMLKEMGLGNERAKQTILALANSTGELRKGLEMARAEFEKNEKLNREFAEVMNTVNAIMMVLWNNIKLIGIRIFDKYREKIMGVLEVMYTGIQVIGKLVEAFFLLDGSTQQVIIAIGAFLAILGPILIAVGAVVSVMAAMGSVGLVIIAALTGIAVAFFSVYEDGRNAADALNLLMAIFIELMTLGEKFKRGWLTIEGTILLAAQAVNKVLMAFVKGMTLFQDNPITRWVQAQVEEVDNLMAQNQEKFNQSFFDEREIRKKFERIKNDISNMVGELHAEGGEGLVEGLVGDNEKIAELKQQLKDLLGEDGSGLQGLLEGAKGKYEELREAATTTIEESYKEIEMKWNPAVEEHIKALEEGLEKNELWGDYLDSEMNPLVKKWGDTFNEESTKMRHKQEEQQDETEKTKDTYEDLADTIKLLQREFKAFGIEADSTLGKLVAGGHMLMTTMEGIFKDGKKGLIQSGDFFGAAQAGISGAAGIISATGSGSRGSRIAGGAMQGAAAGGAIGGPIGAGIGAGVGALVGLFRGGGTLDQIESIGREMGVKVSESLAESIRESGEPAQLAIGAIFAEGGMSVDRFAEEIGDLFSSFEMGEISAQQLVSAFDQNIPTLIARLQELGPAGEEQLNRIIEAAKASGMEFEQLGALINATFAPETLESIMDSFGLTNAQVRELAELTGAKIQTNLERMATTLGLSVEEMKQLGAAVESEYGIPMEDIQSLLEAMGISAKDLAAGLGIEVAGGAEDLSGKMAEGNEQLDKGLKMAQDLADALARAATNAGNINIPSAPSAGAQVGFHSDVLSPMSIRVAETGPERVDIGPTGGGEGGGSPTFILQVDGTKLGEIISEGSKTGSVRISPTAVREF